MSRSVFQSHKVYCYIYNKYVGNIYLPYILFYSSAKKKIPTDSRI